MGQVENPDIADTYNTVLKMGKKRAFLDATIQALAVSDLFTQDVEDFAPQAPEHTPPPKGVTPPQATVEPPSDEPSPTDQLWAQIIERMNEKKWTTGKLTMWAHKNHVVDDPKKLNGFALQALLAHLGTE